MNLLDQIIAATERAGAAVIVSEEHDTGAINWVAGMSDPGEMIACGAYQQLRRQHGESDEQYQARIERELAELPADHAARIRQAGSAAAIGRASLDTSTGRVAVMIAGKAPWHRLGVNVAEAVNSADAIRLASLGWNVVKTPLSYVDVTGTRREAPGVFAIIRSDTQAMLGHVGSRYAPIQNAEGFDFLDSVLAEHGARYETAGAVHGGKRVWMLCHLPKHAFAVNGNDKVEPYVLFANSHDGTGAAECYPTSERVCCANTLRLAGSKRDGGGINIRHTGKVRDKVRAAQSALAIAVDGIEQYKQQAEAMAAAPLPSITHYCDDVLDVVLEVTAADAILGADALAASLKVTEAEQELARKSFAAKIERRGEILQDILDRYESEKNGVNGMRGSVWSGFNAITEHADHNRIGRQVGNDEARESRRFDSVLTGPADQLKQAALTRAMQLV